MEKLQQEKEELIHRKHTSNKMAQDKVSSWLYILLTAKIEYLRGCDPCEPEVLLGCSAAESLSLNLILTVVAW